MENKNTGLNVFSKSYLAKLIGISATVSVMALSTTAHADNTTQPSTQQKPNVLVVLLDDVGFADIGSYGSEIKTPNIDNLAYSGIRYNRFDTNSICAPTRASLLTGRNAQTVNMEELPPKGTKSPAANVPLGAGPNTSGEIPLNAQNVAQALHATGYSTYALGKWHLAPEYKDNPERNHAFWPLQRGFDSYYGFISGHTDQWKPELIENNKEIPTPKTPGYHLSVDLVDHAIKAFDEKTDKPKFVYLALGAAHAPLHVPKEYIDAYKGQYDKGWDVLRQERFERQKKLGIIPANTILPERANGDKAWDSLDDQHKRVFSRFMETYAGFMTHTDDQIGRLIDHLKATGQYDNTMIVFATDNGAAAEAGQDGGFKAAYMDKTTVAEMDKHLDEAGGPSTYMLYQRPWAAAGSAPFHRYKLWPSLGGVRTPLAITWPGHIKEAGIRHQYVNMIDIAPTILEAAGTKFADEIDGVKQIPVAGKSILKTLNDPTAKTRDTQFFELRGQRAITQGKWRAVAYHKLNTDFADDKWQLFNTEEDFSESTDLASKYPKKVEEMKKLWWSEAKKYSDPAVVKPVEFLYKFNKWDDNFKD